MADTIKTNLGPVTAYADAKAHGYTGTREEFGQLLANAGLNLKDAETAKEGAEAAKQAAETAQKAAAENQKNAETQAANAKASADTAAGQANAAKESATGAANSASAAKKSETNAGQSATAASNAEAAAKQAQNSAETAKTDAETAQTAAGNSADAAANSAADAKRTLESIPDDYSTLSGKVDENTSGISELKVDISELQKRQNVLVGSETGNPVSCDNAFAAPLCGLNVYGKSTQDGTPTPDAPVPIVSAGDSGSVAVKVTSANMLEGTKIGTTLSISNVALTTNENGISVVGKDIAEGAFFLHNDVKTTLPRGIYYLTTKGITAFVSINFYQIGSFTSDVQNKEIKITNSKDYSCLLTFAKGATLNTTVQVSLTRNKTTAYSPYHEQLLTLQTPTGLPGIPVTSGGNYTDQSGQRWICDEVDLERGVRVKNTCIVDAADLKITTSTDLQSTKRLTFSSLPALASSTGANALCNRSVMITSFDKDITHFYVNKSNIFLFIPISAENPVAGEYIFLYALAAPIETPLTPAEITAYKALTTYAPNTVVQVSDGAGIRLGYQRDVNLVVKNLEDAIASMTTA